MKFCKRCGRNLRDSISFCTGCGLKQPKKLPKPLAQVASSGYDSAESAALATVEEQYMGKSALSSIIWSLILVIFFNPIGTPLSVAAAILSVIANTDEIIEMRNRKLHIAFVLCIIATTIDVLSYILLITAAIPFLRAPHGI